MQRTPNIYSIPAEHSFADRLVRGILDTYGQNPETLSTIRLFLPSRRACKTVQDAFLRANDGVPLLLPQLQPLGDIDPDELSFGQNFEDIPPAISQTERQILLARLLEKRPGQAGGPAERLKLAQALAQLMDRVHTQNLDLKDLPRLVDQERFAQHWQITLDFLSILSEHWPSILAERGVIDPADRRNRLIKAQTQMWQDQPPQTPVIIAGSTGSIPAVTALMDCVRTLPQGCIVLPGLDQTIDRTTWALLEPTHPQYTMKLLLETLDVTPETVNIWPACTSEKMPIDGKFLTREIVRPAETTEIWTHFKNDPGTHETLQENIQNIRLYECTSSYEEAMTIALALRETLETPGRTACLVTPDRMLAAKVSFICQKWGIDLDDSGGQSLTQTRAGSFILMVSQLLSGDFKPTDFLATLKHTLCWPETYETLSDWQADMYQADLCLRGPYFGNGLADLKEYIHQKSDFYRIKPPSEQFFETINSIFEPFLSLDTQKGTKELPFEDILRVHITICDSLSAQTSLWSNEDGETAALLFHDINDHAATLTDIPVNTYSHVIKHFMDTVSVRPRYGTHPRLQILGQIEARMIQADRVILGSLNEGTWPDHPAADPWMSAPMRSAFGLPEAEVSIGLSAHDFIQGLSSKEVILTRAERSSSGITVPSRWLQRLDAILEAAGLNLALVRADQREHTKSHYAWAQHINRSEHVQPVERPSPCPPVDARPVKLSVTQVDTWLTDPYAIYASKILTLRALDPIEHPTTAALKGTILHDALEQTFQADTNPATLKHRLLQALQTQFHQNNLYNVPSFSMWKPHLSKITDWLATHEHTWQTTWQPTWFEKSGTWHISDPYPFTLTARADRIDLNKNDKSAAILDYKSAGTFSKKSIISGKAPQLALEGLILTRGAFEDVDTQDITTLAYLILSGGAQAGKHVYIDGKDLDTALNNAQAGLQKLIASFYGPDPAPYKAVPDLSRRPRYNDYEHLERLSEWASPDMLDQEAA